ncbi:MAG TPA: KH domain-containing protein [Candidatus Rubrimentiphilum sp.]|nr:KH domain-containing protein [Candidatus Rubrimentiphilum sp.]
MSAYDDEFGLFGDKEEEGERRSTLGARKIASNETIIDDVEPEDEAPPRRRPSAGGPVPRRRPMAPRRAPDDPIAAQKRASDLLEFLAKKLVSKADEVVIESFPAENGEQPLIEIGVDPEDIGKVIGRGGRVAHALRTIVRATAEGRIQVEILDTDEFYDDGEGDEGEEPQDAPE